MANVILILTLEATTVNNTSNSRSDSGVISGVTVEQQQERWKSNMEPRTQLQSLNARIDDMSSKQIRTEVPVDGRTVRKYSFVSHTVDSAAVRKSLLYSLIITITIRSDSGALFHV